MNGSIAAIVTMGYGSFGSANLVVTMGYGSGAVVATVNGVPHFVAGSVYIPGGVAGAVFVPGFAKATVQQGEN